MLSLNCYRRHHSVPQMKRKQSKFSPSKEETASEPSSASSPVDTPPQKPPEVEIAQMNVTPPETIEKFGQAYTRVSSGNTVSGSLDHAGNRGGETIQSFRCCHPQSLQVVGYSNPAAGVLGKIAGRKTRKETAPPAPEKNRQNSGIQTGISHLANPPKTTASLEFLPEEERQVVLNVAAQILAASGTRPYAAGDRGAPKADRRMEQEEAPAGAEIRRKLESREAGSSASIRRRSFRRAATEDLSINRCVGQSDGTVGVAFNGGSSICKRAGCGHAHIF